MPAIMLALFGCAILLFDFLVFPDPRQRKYLLIFLVLARSSPASACAGSTAALAANGCLS